LEINGFKELYPFSSNYLDIGGLKYHYLDEGEGPILLMLHGNPTWSFYYRNLILALRENYRVIVPDHMGCGFSDKPQDYDYRLKTHIDNLSLLLDDLKITKMSMLVHDWGGPIGLGCILQQPEILKKLVVFNTTAFLTTQYPKRILLCKMPIIGTLAIRCFNYFALAASYMCSKKKGKMTAEVRAGYLKPYNSYENRIANQRFVQDIPLNDKHPTWETGLEMSHNLHKIEHVPKLICWGKQDFCFNDHFLESWKNRFPDADVHEFDYAGHYVVEDAIDDIIPLVTDFLSS